MDANKIEQTYQETMFGRDEPDIAYLSGKTLKAMCEELGDPITHDTEGNPIFDGECYCMMAGKGIFRVE